MGDGGTVGENEKQCFLVFLVKNTLVLIKALPGRPAALLHNLRW